MKDDIVARIREALGQDTFWDTDAPPLLEDAVAEIERLREKCNSRTRWLQTCMRARYEHLTDGAKEFADALFDEELEPEPPG
jgi:hypothetical protein